MWTAYDGEYDFDESRSVGEGEQLFFSLADLVAVHL